MRCLFRLHTLKFYRHIIISGRRRRGRSAGVAAAQQNRIKIVVASGIAGAICHFANFSSDEVLLAACRQFDIWQILVYMTESLVCSAKLKSNSAEADSSSSSSGKDDFARCKKLVVLANNTPSQAPL